MGRLLVIKVKEKGSREGYEYKNSVNLDDPNLITLIFEDLTQIFNAPIRKACSKFLGSKSVFPFSPK